MSKITEATKLDAVERYLKGDLLTTIANHLCIDRGTVSRIIKNSNVPMHSREYTYRKASGHSLDETAFDTLTDRSAYWAGFLMADGCVHDTTIALVLNKKDLEHLEKFKKFVKGTQQIVEVGDAFRYAFQSVHMAAALERYGVIPNKSLIASCPKELSLNRDFWRGVVDGDGYLGIIERRGNETLVRIELCGSSFMMNQFAFFVKQAVNIDVNVTKMKSIWRVTASGLKAESIINFLYEDCSDHLDRKKSIADDVVNGARGIFIRALVDSPCDVNPSVQEVASAN